MAPHFFLRCLGSPELRGPGGEPIRFRTRKHLALLVFLAVERRTLHSRDKLADLLWPDASPAEGRHSLATALSVIRGKLGPRAFETSRESVRLVASDLEVDLERLARGQVLGDETTPPLDVTDFLEEFEVGKAREYMLWRDLVRARWLPAIRDALVLLMDRCRRTGDFTKIAFHADRLQAIDEFSEPAIRAKMEACAFAGDRITAIRIFQVWRQKLAEVLDTKPTPLVEGIALRLRQRGYEHPGTSHVPTVPTDLWRNRSFVGRATQYRVLYERWEETNGGRGRHGLVLGDSGIGKTTLVERLTTAASLEGAASSRVQCYEVEREIPYAAIGTVVRGLLDRPGASGTPPEWLAELARAIPAVAVRYPNLPPAREAAGEAARLRLTEAVHELVSAIAEEHPVILVVDDVHLADDASVAVLHLLMRRTQDQRIMVIMTARQAELANSPHASRLLEHREALGLVPVELPPLTDEEMSEVVTALAGAAGVEMPPAVRQALLRASAGVPMIVELLFDDWRVHGEQCLALSVGAMTVDAFSHDQREVYHRIFERTLRELSDPARAVLNLAAILGERLNDLTMYELVDLSLAQTLAGMAELAQFRILRDGGREVEFRNELLRSYTYLSVPSPLRRALHGLIADRLLMAEAKGEHIPGLMLAWHCFRAGRPVEAEPYLLRGSREGLRRGGTFEVELALTSAMKGLTHGSVIDAQLLLAEALQEQGRWSESVAVIDHAEAGSVHHQLRCRSLRLTARAVAPRNEIEARNCLSDLREFLASTTDVTARAQAIESMRFLAFYLGDCDEGERTFAEAEQLLKSVTDLSDRLLIYPAYAALTWLTQRGRECDDAIEQLNDLVRESQAAGISDSRVARIYNFHGCLLAARGKYAEALDRHALAFALARKHGNALRERTAAGNLSMCHGRLGHYQEQQRWAEKALQLTCAPIEEWDRIQHVSRLAWSFCMQGENSKGVSAFEELAPVEDSSGRLWVRQARELLRADVYLLAKSEAKAFSVARSAFESTDYRPPNSGYIGVASRWRALLASGSEGLADARRHLDGLLPSLKKFDLVDQAEVVAARLWLDRNSGNQWVEGRALLADLLGGLPPAVELQLRRLTMI